MQCKVKSIFNDSYLSMIRFHPFDCPCLGGTLIQVVGSSVKEQQKENNAGLASHYARVITDPVPGRCTIIHTVIPVNTTFLPSQI